MRHLLLLLLRYSIPRAGRNDSRKVLFPFFLPLLKTDLKADDMKGDVHSVNRQPEVEKREMAAGLYKKKKKQNVNGRFDTSLF